MVVTVSCAACKQELHLPPAAITVAEFPNGVRYSFTCTDCGAHCSKPTDEDIRGLLRLAGLERVIPCPRPATINGEPIVALPLTTSDLADLLLDLHEQDTAAELLS